MGGKFAKKNTMVNIQMFGVTMAVAVETLLKSRSSIMAAPASSFLVIRLPRTFFVVLFHRFCSVETALVGDYIVRRRRLIKKRNEEVPMVFLMDGCEASASKRALPTRSVESIV